MIHQVLPVIKDELNQHFRARFQLPAEVEKVILSELIQLDGSVAFEGHDLIVGTLLKVDQELVHTHDPPGGNPGKIAPFHSNIHLLFSACFHSKDYVEGIQFLSGIMSYFQAKPVFNSENTPGLPAQMQKVTAEMVSLDLPEWSQLWTALGSKHLPAVLYRLRLLSIPDEMLREDGPEISAVERNTKVSR